MIVKKCSGVHTLRKVVGIAMLALLLAGSANAANLTVCPIGCEYSSIQKAINASSNGDIVLVQSGTYFENVNVTKQLTLRGIGNPVVDAGGSGSAITLAADGINLEGFTATGGGGYYDSPVAGIKVTSSLNMLTGNNASNNGYNGYGIHLSSSSNNTLTGNSASNNLGGGGISLISSSNNTLSGNFASSNGEEDQVGFGISLSSSSNNNTLSGNIAWHNEETGISLSSSNNNTLFGNNANGNNNGITLSTSNNNTLTGNNALNNGGEEYGGSGISLFSSNNNKLTGNTASNNGELDQGGSGISLSDSNNNFLIGNNANGNNNGITLSSSYNNALIGNIVSNNNVGIQLYNSNNNKIYNNIFKNTKNVFDSDININAWNTKKQSGTNIIGGPIIGGNFWGYPNGTGFSQTCKDMNNNGICEKRYILDANNIDYLPLSMNFTKDKIPPKSVSNLKNITYAKNYINWTWTDPKNIDFKTVMVFIDNKFKMNVSKGKMYYNATNFTANTRHTISTRTVDMNGNINKTWKNSSAWTAK